MSFNYSDNELATWQLQCVTRKRKLFSELHQLEFSSDLTGKLKLHARRKLASARVVTDRQTTDYCNPHAHAPRFN